MQKLCWTLADEWEGIAHSMHNNLRVYVPRACRSKKQNVSSHASARRRNSGCRAGGSCYRRCVMETSFGGPEKSPGLLLWRTMLVWRREVNAALASLNLTHSQFVLLTCTWWLETHGDGPATQVAISDLSGLDVRTTSQGLRNLELDGFVRRASAPGDKRALIVATTEKGREAGQAAIAKVEEVDERFFLRRRRLRSALLMEAKQPRDVLAPTERPGQSGTSGQA